MKINKIEHIGITVRNIDESLAFYEGVWGFNWYNIEEVADLQVWTVSLKVGDVKIELLEPTSEDSTITKSLETKGSGIHHIAYAVEDGMTEALQQCEDAGIRLIDKSPRKGVGGLQISFLHPKSSGGVLAELCES